MRRFRWEIALAIVGVAATILGFAAGPAWGWRVLGAALLALCLRIFFVTGGAYLMPGARAGYADGKAAFAIGLLTAAMGLGLIVRAGELSVRACRAMPLPGCAPPCTNADLVSVTSPTRSVRAIRFVRSCDAPAGVTTHVSIVAVGEPLGSESGNALIVDGKADLVLMWIGGRQLAISGMGAAPPRLQKTYLNGIRISYDEPRR